MSKVYAFSSYKSRAKHENFKQYLESRLGELPRDVAEALEPLAVLHWDFWSRAAQFAQKALRRGGWGAMVKRLNYVIGLCEFLQAHDLTMQPCLAQVSQAYADHDRLRLSSQGEVIKEVARTTEMIAADLLMHCLEGNERITKVSLRTMSVYQENLDRIARNTWLGNGLSARTLESIIKNARGAEGKRIGEFHHRVQGIAEFFIEDLGWVGWQGFVTAPSRFHPVTVDGDVNPAWVAAGRPSPRDAADWLLSIMDAVRSACAGVGIQLPGFRTFESHGSFTAHLNLVLYFESDDHRTIFNGHLSRLYREHDAAATGGERNLPTPAFSVSQQAIVGRDFNSMELAREATGYASKNVLPSKIASDDRQQRDVVLAATDRQWCKLWGISQYWIWGVDPVWQWRTFQQLDPRLMQSDEALSVYPAAVIAAAKASRIGDEMSYRVWLRITDTRTPDHLRCPVKGRLAPMGKITMLRCKDDASGAVVIRVVAHANPEAIMHAVVAQPQWERLTSPDDDDQIAPSGYSCLFQHNHLQLRISLPTTPAGEAQLQPKRRRFDFTRRSSNPNPTPKAVE